MRGVVELVQLLSMLVTMAALLWAGFGVISAEPSIGGATGNTAASGLKLAALGGIAFVVTALLKKRMS